MRPIPHNAATQSKPRTSTISTMQSAAPPPESHLHSKTINFVPVPAFIAARYPFKTVNFVALSLPILYAPS
jgi:hypothetical protein